MKARVLAMVLSVAVAGCGESLDQQLDNCAKALETSVISFSKPAYDQHCKPLPKEKILAAAQLASERAGRKITLDFEEAKPPSPAPPPAPSIPGIGRSYAQVTAGLTTTFAMEDSALRDGTPRRMGKSKEGAAILEVVGPAGSEVVRTAMMFFAVTDDMGTNITNIGLTSRFIYNVFPGWKDAEQIVLKELTALPKKVKGNGGASKTLSHDDKEIRLSYVKALGMFTISIKNRAAQDS